MRTSTAPLAAARAHYRRAGCGRRCCNHRSKPTNGAPDFMTRTRTMSRRPGYYNTQQVIDQLCREVAEAGGTRAFARKHLLSAAYVSDVLLGRRGPGPSVLKILRLEKCVMVTYHRVYS